MDRSHPIVKEWIQTIHYAIQNGITLLDTAPWYGHGTSEVIIGWALEELFANDKDHDGSDQAQIQRDDLVINTKVGRYEADPNHQFDFSYEKTIQSVQLSLQRIKCQYINVLQLHDPEFAPTLDVLLQQTIPAMIECQNRGYCRSLGMTGYPLEVQHQILEATITQNDSKLLWSQCLTYSHFNLHDTSLFTRPISNDAPASFADWCASVTCSSDKTTPDNAADTASLTVMAAAPLSMGLLCHTDPPEWHPAGPELQDACREAANMAQQAGVNISSLAILFALSQPRIPCTLLGMKNLQQVDMAVALARRFENLADVPGGQSQHDILKQVLTETEYKVLKELRDPDHGPFAQIWKDGTFRWDGTREAREFWKQVEGVKAANWHRGPV